MLTFKFPKFVAAEPLATLYVVRRLCLLIALAASALGVTGQALDETIYTVGTSIQDAAHRNWGYILWQGSTPELVQNKHYAIYSKAGDATASNPFFRQAIVGVQTDPAVIKVILNRSINLGENLGELENRINNLFQKVIPAGTLRLEDKISAVIRGARNDPNYFNNLVVLAHLHPSISMCLGLAHAAILDPGLTTFEVREFDFATSRDLGVVGRVTVQAGVAIVLPPAGPPIAVPDTSPKGDLNVRLRWATPDDLRRLGLLNYGFNVYRMTKTYAEAHGYHTTPPAPAILIGLLTATTEVKQLNELPVLKNRDYTIPNAANLTIDPGNSFFADDNKRYSPGGVAFNNGDQFYYFIAPRDVLGRIGSVSPGTLVTICDRLPPNAPNGVQVVNDYSYVGGVSKQVLKVRWKQDTQKTDKVKAYYVYRWQSPADVQKLAGSPLLHRIAGPITHIPNAEFNSYIDDGGGSPSMPADAGKTWWYTVRSEDTSACGGNLSANSGPAFGVLRDRTGPDAPGGYVQINCRHPHVEPGRIESVADQNQREDTAYYTLVCERRDVGIAWAEFWALETTASSNYLGRFPITEKGLGFVSYSISRAALANLREVDFFCRVGSPDGQVSNIAIQTQAGIPKFGERRIVNFDAYTFLEKVTSVAGRKQDCIRHSPTGPGDPGGTGTVTPTVIVVTLTPGTKEYKLYRRVDNGPLTLIKQAPANFDDVSSVPIEDDSMPPNAATVCYYAQLFDEHGNPSPMTLVGGDCILISGTTPIPAPMLSALQISGTEASPKMTIKWFCPPFGIDRFNIHIAVDPDPMPVSIASALSDYISSTPTPTIYKLHGENHTNDFYTYRTPHIGPGFGNGAQFDIDVAVVQGKAYTVFITAIGKDASEGPKSNFEDGSWSPAVVTGPKVPWPARPLPPFNLFNSALDAVRLSPSIFDGVGVQIGWITDRTVVQSDKGQPFIYSDKDPMTYVHTNKIGDKLFPVAMYRVQLVNPAFPTVSGDVIQVSPLMENIAYNQQTVNGVTQTDIKDPFIRIASPPAGTNLPISPMYLVDTQPVIANARYVYLLVRFDQNHEIKEIVPSSIVEVTP